MEQTLKPVRIPPHVSAYADKHHVLELVQGLVSRLVVEQPDDPVSFLLRMLRTDRVDAPRLLLLGPPAAGKHTVARKLSAELRAVLVTVDSLLQDQSELDEQALAGRELPEALLLRLLQNRLNQTDCFTRGWVLVGIPQSRLQALSLQRAGVLPEHVVMLDAPDEVLLERSRGRWVDPLTGDVYHQTFIWPEDRSVAQRLERGRSLSEGQPLAELHHYRCEVTGLTSAYQHILKVVSSDQPLDDVYGQVLAFVRTRCYSRTPRILLLGPPGSGKSHQARLLSEKYKMVDVCCGHLLRSVAAEGSSVGAKIQAYVDEGRPVPDHLVLQVLEQRLSQVDSSCRGWVLHGFPCDLQQAQRLREAQHEPNRVFFLELTDDVCLERITLRATDPVSGVRFHALTRPAPSRVVQSRLKTRPEDGAHTVARALNQYRLHAAALQSVYPDAVHIDADQDPRSVFEALESRLTTQ